MQIRLLGPLEVTSVEGARAPVSAPMLRALLAALALRPGQVVSISELGQQLWGEEPPPSARTTLRNYVMRLRKALPGDRIQTAAGGYQLQIDEDDTDLGHFRALMQARSTAEGPTAALRLTEEALALWRGSPLADIGDCPLRLAEQPRLEELRLSAVEERFELKTALGEYAEIVDELTPLVETHYLRERLVRYLMLALHRSGRATAALAVYRSVHERFIEELGLEPGAELQAVHGAIRGEQPGANAATNPADPRRPEPDTPGPPPPSSAAFPAAASAFVAREREVAVLRNRLAEPATSPPVCLIDGPGGVGKSTLAIRASWDLAAHYPDGLLYADLHGADPRHPARDPNSVLRQLLTTLGEEPGRIPGDLDDAVRLYHERLRGRRILILLDNALNAQQVLPLLPVDPGNGVIITSRAMLRLPVEGHHFHLDRLTDEESVRLLRSAVGGGSRLPGPGSGDETAEECAAWTELARLCGQLPLALRIVATRMAARPHWSVSDWAEVLRQEHGRIDQLRVADLDLRASLMVSVDQLASSGDPVDASAALFFPWLGATSVRGHSAETIAALTGSDPAEARAALERLTDARITDSPRPDRFSLHDLLYAAASWQADHQLAARSREGVVRLAAWYLGSLYRMNQHLALHDVFQERARRGARTFPQGRSFSGAHDALRWTDEVKEDVLLFAEQLAAVEYDGAKVLDGRPLSAFALHAALALEPHCAIRLDWRYQERLCRLVRRIAVRHDDTFAEAVALAQLGKVAGQREELDGAWTLLQEAAERYRDVGEHFAATTVVSNQIACLALQGRLEEAIGRGEQCLAEARAAGQDDNHTTLLNNLSWSYLRQGRLERSLRASRESYRQARFPYPRTIAAGLISEYHLAVREYQEAARWAERALGHSREQPLDPYTVAHVRSLLAKALERAGQSSAAQAQAEEARSAVEALNEREASNVRLHIVDFQEQAGPAGGLLGPA